MKHSAQKKPLSYYLSDAKARPEAAPAEYQRRLLISQRQLPGVVDYWHNGPQHAYWPPAAQFARSAAFAAGPTSPTLDELAALVEERAPALDCFTSRARSGWFHNCPLIESMSLEAALRQCPTAVLVADTGLMLNGKGRMNPPKQGILPWLVMAHWWRQAPHSEEHPS